MRREEALGIIERALKLSKADDTLAALSGGSECSTRFADNRITENISSAGSSLSVTCAFGNSWGTATTDDLTDEGLRGAVGRAEEIARVSPPDPEYMPPLPAGEAEKYLPVEAFSAETAAHGPEEKARAILAASKIVGAKKGLRLSGAFATFSSFNALASSSGLEAYHRKTASDFRATVLTTTSSGWAEKRAVSVGELDAEGVAGSALEKAELAKDPADAEPGKYTLIMAPAAAAELLAFFFWGGFDAKAADEGRTFLRGKLGKKICADSVTLRSDPSHSVCPAIPFGRDGLAAGRREWISRGVVKNLFYSRFWAKKQNKEATGWPSNILMDGGGKSLDEIIASTDKGLFVTRFWYIRYVDPMIPLVTGMTRDGLFRIEKGRLAGPLKHMRFNEDIAGVLSRVEALGIPERTGEYFPMHVPPLKVSEFNFTSATKF